MILCWKWYSVENDILAQEGSTDACFDFVHSETRLYIHVGHAT